jgi:hypothetical protein
MARIDASWPDAADWSAQGRADRLATCGLYLAALDTASKEG